MLQRNLLYTGITRGKQLVVLVGQARPWRSPSKMCPAGGDGRSWMSGWRNSGIRQPTHGMIPRCATRRAETRPFAAGGTKVGFGEGFPTRATVSPCGDLRDGPHRKSFTEADLDVPEFNGCF